MKGVTCPYCGEDQYSAYIEPGSGTCIYCKKEFMIEYDSESREYHGKLPPGGN